MLKDDLKQILLEGGAFDVRVASPNNGFEHALPGKHPLELMPDCRSVIVIVLAQSAEANNTYAGGYSPYEAQRGLGPIPQKLLKRDVFAMQRLKGLFMDSITLRCIKFLDQRGHKWYADTAKLQCKLSAYEAGVGIYGKSGLILNPTLGNKLGLGVILTDAELAPDEKCEGYYPCETCNACRKACPGQAYGDALEYHGNWTMQKCLEAREKVQDEGFFCHNCFAVCPAGKLKDHEVFRVETVTSYINAQGAFGK